MNPILFLGRNNYCLLQVTSLSMKWQHLPWLPLFSRMLQHLTIDAASASLTSSRRFSNTLMRLAGTADHLQSISLSGPVCRMIVADLLHGLDM